MIELLSGQVIAPPSVAPWWMGAGVTPIVVYQPWHSSTFYTGFVNCVDSNTHLIVSGEAADWSPDRGWKFDGDTHYHDLNIVPGPNWSMLVLFRNADPGGTLAGIFEQDGREFRLIVDASGDVVLYGNGGRVTVDGGMHDGCLIVAGQQGYRNGVADGDPFAEWDGHPVRDIWIGARANDLLEPTAEYEGDILAFAAWDVTLSASQVEQLYRAAMQATHFDDLTTISGRTLWSSSPGHSPAHDWVGRPVLVNLNGTWIAAYRSAISHTGDLDEPDEIHLRFSSDEGLTWSDEDELLDGTPITGAPFEAHAPNTAAGADLMIAPNGDLLLHVGEVNAAFTAIGVYQWRSTDDGATWSDEGAIDGGNTELYHGQDYTYVNNYLYMSGWMDENSDGVPLKSVLYRTADSGVTWEHVADITDYADETNECSIEYLGGDGDMISILRSDDATMTWMCRSSNYGVTWTAPEDVTSVLGTIHRPRMKYVGSRLYLFGRAKITLTSPQRQRTVLWYSDEDAADGSWRGPFYANDIVTDTGYCDMMPRSNGDLYVLTYEGATTQAAAVVEYVMRVNR